MFYRVQGLSGTTNILGALANRLNTEAHNDKVINNTLSLPDVSYYQIYITIKIIK